MPADIADGRTDGQTDTLIAMPGIHYRTHTAPN